MMKKFTLYLIIMFAVISCKKQDEWLDAKSNKADIVPTTLQDFQAILDNNSIMNSGYPTIGIIGSDNSYVTDALAISGGTVAERNAYKWASDIYEGTTLSSDWTNPYRVIEYANIVLDGIGHMKETSTNQTLYDNVKGSALFYRAIAFYHLAQIYCKPFTASSALTDLGIIIRTSSDVNISNVRSSVSDTYARIIDDLKASESLLEVMPLYKTRPSKPAAQMMLAKTYLLMAEYKLAKEYCDKVLDVNNQLLEFNSLNAKQAYPFPTYQIGNSEVLFYNLGLGYTFNGAAEMLVVKDLYDSYSTDDLRKTLFFKINADGTINFRGRYSGTLSIFSGLGINEVYLIRAECQVRNNQLSEGMKDLNTLLKSRWRKAPNGISTYIDQSASTELDALTIILAERRKEIPFTGNVRWEDLRRLNMDTRFTKSLKRTINGIPFELLPNDSKYVFPIPPAETVINPVIQNPR